MWLFACLVWGLLFGTLGASAQLANRAKDVNLNHDGAPRSSFFMLPVFVHSPAPLVPQEVTRPVSEKRALDSDLAALLLPAEQFQQPVHGASPRAVAVWCDMDTISVRLDRHQMSAWRDPSRFRLGSCAASTVNPRFIFFHSRLSDCHGQFKVSGGTLVYTYFLVYTPPAQGQVIRVPPLYLPINCHYNRFHYSYKVAYRPQVQQATFMKSLRRELSFSLTVYNALWEPPSPGHWFLLGEQVYFVAQTGALLDGERLYVDSCYATSSPDPNGMPKMDIITNYGCMTDSRREDSSSRFLLRGNDFVQFSVDVFLFRTASQVQYLHCLMSVGWTVSHTAKSCNYNKAVGRWEEFDASVSVCSCCDSMCGDRQPSNPLEARAVGATPLNRAVKTTVSSPSWIVEQKDENKSLRMTSVKAEEGKQWLELPGRNGEEVNVHEKAQAFLRETKIAHEDKKKVFVENREWRLVTVSQQAKKEMEKSPVKELSPRGIMMPNERKTHEHIEAGEKVLDSKTDSVVILASDKKILSPSEHGSGEIVAPTRNLHLDFEYNTTNEDVSSTITPDPRIDSNSDSITWSSVAMGIQHEISENSTEDDNMNTFFRSKSFTQTRF